MKTVVADWTPGNSSVPYKNGPAVEWIVELCVHIGNGCFQGIVKR